MIRLLGDSVLLKLDPEHLKESPGGILLVEAIDPKSRQRGEVAATVIAVGPGTEEYPVDVSPGDRVLVPKLAGDNLLAGIDALLEYFPAGTTKGEEFRIARESEILGILCDS